MLTVTPCKWNNTMSADGVRVKFSLASEDTKVSVHALDALLGLIT